MVIEWLEFWVDPTAQAAFLEADAAIWTACLQGYPGFERKEIWMPPEGEAALVCVIWWTSYDQWKAIPEDVLRATEIRFQTRLASQGIGPTAYRLEVARHFTQL